MSERASWNITGRASGDRYVVLLQNIAKVATGFAFLVRSSSVTLSDGGRSVMDALTPYLLDSDETQEWPGTRLVGSRVSTLYRYRLGPESLEVLLSSTSDLADWVNPALPEDLHFFRNDGSTVLGNVAQEGDAWLELDESEAAIVVPHLSAELGLQRA